MLLVEPPPSQGDLHFRLFGIPVRIHPYFWLVSLIMGVGQETPPQEVLLWIVAVAVSIVIHELGHAIVQRRFGGRPRIVLYGMGGLAICEDCDRSTRSQILISLAGPFAGFAFALLILALLSVAGHGLAILVGDRLIYSSGSIGNARGVSMLGVGIYLAPFANNYTQHMIFNFLYINILWGLVNLLPIYPLDGGRVAREVCQIGHPRTGIVLSLRISMFAAAAMAVVGLVMWQSIFTALLFGYLAYSNYQTLEAYQQSAW